jgi:hypothetical protein
MNSDKGAAVSVWNRRETLELVAIRKSVIQKYSLTSYFSTFELTKFLDISCTKKS